MSTLQTKVSREAVPAKRGGGLDWVDLVQDLGLLLVLLVGGAALTLVSPVFFSRINIENLLFSSTIIAVMAIGQTFVILVAGIDLSVGAVMALASVLCVGLPLHFGVPVGAAALIALLVGGLLGLINGLNVTITKIPALIATLAMLTVARGVAFIYSGGQNIAPVPDVYVDIQAMRVFGFPLIIFLTALLAILAHVVLTRTRFGRAVYATGGNPVASRLAGIRTTRVILLAYVISGLTAALGGLMITARLEAGAATSGQGMELTVISAAVIGGVSLFGGEGKIVGVMLGVLLLGLVGNAINLLNVPPNYDYVVSGFVIAIAAALDVYRRQTVEASLKRRTALNKKTELAAPADRSAASQTAALRGREP